MDAEPRRRFSWLHVLFGVAAVSTVAMTAFPFSAYNFGRLCGVLGMAFLVRLGYVKLRRDTRLPLWSGWIFVLALGAAFLARAGQHDDAVEQSSKAAVEHGVVASKADATPRDRCMGLALEDWDAHLASRVDLPRRTIRIFVRRVCARADADGVLQEDGSIPGTSARALGREVAVEMRSEGLLP
jgi:catechol 2,3-dioxygenase-like lactoylglutathione lyase family enzyme